MKYLVRRVRLPDLIGCCSGDSDTAEALGGNPEWFWGVPGVFHALASPRSFATVPLPPRAGSDHQEALGYWTPLHNLLLYRLGWSRPDLGLRWWYQAGKPVDDPTLALVAEIWDRDRLLDGYTAWLLRMKPRFLNNGWDEFAPVTEDDLSPDWAAWLRAANEAHNDSQYPWFQYAMEGDSLHLTSSGGQRHESNPAASITVIDRSARRAILVTSQADSWYFSLIEHSKRLPDIGAQSWHVEVIVTPIGSMGTFRRSRDTGFWFSSRHQIHAAGN